MKRITIEPISRIEGHGKITIHLNEEGKVAGTEFHVTQIRGVEKFTEGRPFYEMPGITARICGICPISHELASSKACDAIMALRIPPAAKKLRELIHYAQFVQSHALSFFYLSSPDFLLGMDSDPATRNVLGVIANHPDLARDGIELRKFGLHIIESLATERVHPSWIVPGGVNSGMTQQLRDRLFFEVAPMKAIVDRALKLFQAVVSDYQEEVDFFGSAPTMYAGLVSPHGNCELYDGGLRFRTETGETISDQIPAEDYATWIGEASLRESYLKAPYFKPRGYPAGIYRVGALARLNVIDRYGTPKADAELTTFRQRLGSPAHSAFLYHYARLVEIVFALERIETLLGDPAILDTHIRATGGVNAPEGVGMIEAPRGILIHHYKVNDEGVITWANLIVATGHNNLAMGKSVHQVAEHFVKGDKLEEGMLNRVSAVVRAYDPCLSCSTHANGQLAMKIKLLSPNGDLLDELNTAD